MADDVRVVFNPEALAALFTSPEGDVARMLVRAGAQVDRRAKRLCPVDTGRLRSSITARLERDSLGLVEKVGTNVEYAPYVELGTRRMAARPFLRPALQAVSEALP